MKKLKSDKCVKNAIQKSSNVVIYGAGGVSSVLTERILREYPNTSLFMAVSAKDGYPYYLLGKKVYCIEELTNLVNNCVVIVATLEKLQEDIEDNLKRLGFKDIYGMSNELYEHRKFCWQEVEQFQNEKLIFYKRYVDPYIKIALQICKDYQVTPKQTKQYIEKTIGKLESESLYIARLVITLGSKCSLRCKECDNLMPHFKPQKDLELAKILSAIEILSTKADNILACNLIGGEPFISCNLYPVLEFLIKKENIFQVTIGTNGTILPKKEYISLLRNKKVKLLISDYGTLVDKQKIINYLKEYNICYEVLDTERWIATGGVDKRRRNVKELQDIYANCYSGYYCKTLYEDKLFSCAKSSSLYALGYMKEREYIEISENTSVKEIKDFLLNPYSIACDYCGRAEDLVYCEPAVQLNV